MSDLPKGWVFSKLGDVCTPSQYGYTAKASDSGNIHYLRTTDITSGAIDWNSVPYCSVDHETREKYLLRDGDIVISRAGSVGYSHLIENPKPSVFASYLIRFKPIIDAKYFKWYLHTPAYWNAISEESLGIAVQNVNASKLSELNFPLAPNSEQTRIVAKLEELLSDLDAGVAELKAAQKKLGQYRQSLLKAAVDGSLTAEWRRNNPATETGAELLERILKERRARWETKQLAKFKEQGKTPPKDWQKKYPDPVQPNTTDLPVLPNEWAWASVDQSTAESLIGLDRGQEQQSSSAAFGYIKMNNVSMSGKVETANITRINASPEEVEKYSVALNDVLFNTRNSLELVGKTGLIRSLDGVTLYNNNLMRLRFDGVLIPAFACLQMCGPEFRSRLEQVKKATTSVAAVYAKDLFPLAIAVPPVNEQIEILRILDLEMSRLDIEQSAIEHLLKQSSAQRQNILRAAFAGQLVPQDPNDEPASVLLERIRAERAARTATKKGRTAKTRKASQ